ncbi:MAG: hypothetical protein AAGC74_10305 [Verrucomicrobiota bacterium]
MTTPLSRKAFEKCWQACLAKATRPVEGVLLPPERASSLAESLMNAALDDASAFDSEASFVAELLDSTSSQSKSTVAHDRRTENNPNCHHDPNDSRYDQNLNLDHLQSQDKSNTFNHPEWSKLLDFLTPFGLRELQKKGITHPDSDDVYSETFSELIREKSGKKPPISALLVFEEIIPLFVRMIQFRAIDWVRNRNTKKNQPNTQDSVEGLQEAAQSSRQFADTKASHPGLSDSLSFEEIYRDCHNVLTKFEWQLIFTIHVAESSTMGELIEKPRVLAQLGVTASDSVSTRRRRLNEALDQALTKLAKALEI